MARKKIVGKKSIKRNPMASTGTFLGGPGLGAPAPVARRDFAKRKV